MSNLLKILFFVGDVFFLNASIFLSFGIAPSTMADRVYLFIFSNLSWLFLVLVSSPYNFNKGWSISKLFKSQVAFIFIHLLVVGSLIFFFHRQYSAIQISLIYVLFVPLFFLWKIVTYYLRKVATPELDEKNYVIVGRNDLSAELRKYYLTNHELGYRFKGYLNDSPFDNGSEEIRQFCVREDIHEVFYCIRNPSQESLNELVKFGLDSLIKVRMVIEPLTSKGGGISFDSLETKPVQDVAVVPLDDPGNQLLKRIFDIVFSTLFLVLVMSWLLPILFLIIKTDSQGPLFFLQARSGKGNRPFMCMKFRTMIVNDAADALQAIKGDPRITRIGAFLRKTSIDELPQFINVFLGQMSVVGPRPHMLRHTEEYSQLIEQFMGRHYVKPGITGLAQCMGYRGETRTLEAMVNRVRLDRHYIENWSFWLDLKIIVLTVISLIRGSDKAY